ncbi:MAG: sulfate/thiosulfate ABC transporter permease CysW, partial [Pseudomonadota bacterium]|nr:sulfate/thiosulfate ABC transporter permease CysW [Pseudomonadota bacterium]
MRRIGDAPLVRRLLIGAALLLSALFLLLPLVAIFAQAFSQGVMVFWENVSNAFTLHAIGLTLVIALMTIP